MTDGDDGLGKMRVADGAIGVEVGIAGSVGRTRRDRMMFMRMVTKVLLGRLAIFVLAIGRHRRSGPLQRQDEQEKDGYELAHGVKG